MSKITNIPSEIRNFFSEKRRSIVMDTFTRLLEGLNLDNRSLGGLKRENCQLTNLQVFQILLLLPFFAIKGFSHYDGSALCRMFGGKKDILYSYLSQDNVDWRNVVYRITNWLLTKVTVRALLAVKREVEHELRAAIAPAQHQSLVAEDAFLVYMREYLANGFHMHARLWKIRVIGYQYGWKQTLLMVQKSGPGTRDAIIQLIADNANITLELTEYC